MINSNINLADYKVSPLSMIFLIEENNILTLKRNSDKKIYPNKVSGFGGKVEPGENLLSSAQREFTEETGLTIKTLSFRGTFIRILDTGYINEMYIFVGRGFGGQLIKSPEGIIQWLDINEFLKNPEIVDHIPLYLNQIIEGKDLYCGIANYVGNKMVSYTDNKSHFEERQ